MTEPETIGELITEVLIKAPAKAVLPKYKVLLCDKCHAPQMTQAVSSCKCLKCGAVNKIFKQGHPRGYMIVTEDPLSAADRVKELELICESVRRSGSGQPLAAYFNRYPLR